MSTLDHWMIVEPYAGGHQAFYMDCLIRSWFGRNTMGRVTVVVGTAFRRWHPEFLDWLATHPSEITVVEEHFETPTDSSPVALLSTDRQHGKIVSRLVNDLRPDRLLLTYLDHFQFSLAFGLRFPFDVDIDGIYFRPTFHYGSKIEWQRSYRDSIIRHLKKPLFKKACSNPHMNTVFSLDPVFVESKAAGDVACDLVWLPEPSTKIEELNAPDSNTVLIIGALTELKGLPHFMNAIDLLPDEIANQGRFVLAGPIASNLKNRVSDWHRRLTGRGITVQVHDRFLNDLEMEQLISGAGLIVLPYQHHVGMSNVLVRASGHGKPVLGPRVGLLGTLIRDHSLGLSVDTSDPKQLADGISEFIVNHDIEGFRSASASNFASGNTSKAFADTILNRTLGSNSSPRSAS